MDPHFHALVLDPFLGAIAYVPDLGMDMVRQFLYVSFYLSRMHFNRITFSCFFDNVTQITIIPTLEHQQVRSGERFVDTGRKISFRTRYVFAARSALLGVPSNTSHLLRNQRALQCCFGVSSRSSCVERSCKRWWKSVKANSCSASKHKHTSSCISQSAEHVRSYLRTWCEMFEREARE